MFTIRFVKHHDAGYRTLSVSSYEVTKQTSDSAKLGMELPDGSFIHEYVGDAQPYGVAYVTNQSGKTIDTIRG